MRSILVTGFEPFADEPRNPSGEIAQALDRYEVDGVAVESLVLPVARAAAARQIDQALERLRPVAVLGLGLALEIPVVHVEQVALNLEDYSIPDDDGAQPRGESIAKAGPDALLSTLPVHELTAAIRAAGVPAAVSLSAGTYLCNRCFYQVLAAASALPEAERHYTGFLHLPPLPDAVAARDGLRASMALETSLRGVQAALQTIADVLHGRLAAA